MVMALGGVQLSIQEVLPRSSQGPTMAGSPFLVVTSSIHTSLQDAIGGHPVCRHGSWPPVEHQSSMSCHARDVGSTRMGL